MTTVAVPDEEIALMNRDAAHPATAPIRLEEIAQFAFSHWGLSSAINSDCLNFFRLLAVHPNTPPRLLLLISPYAPQELLKNPVLPLILLEMPDFLVSLPEAVRKVFVAQEATPAPFIALLRHDPDPFIREIADWHIALRGEADPAGEQWKDEAAELLRGEYRDAKVRLLVRDGIGPRWLTDRLGYAYIPVSAPGARPLYEGYNRDPRHTDSLHQFLLYTHLRLNPQRLAKLAELPTVHFKLAVALNAHLPPESREQLMHHGHRVIRAAARSLSSAPS